MGMRITHGRGRALELLELALLEAILASVRWHLEWFVVKWDSFGLVRVLGCDMWLS